jgi:copper transport protein
LAAARLGLGACLVIVVLSAWAGRAEAHAFLVGTDPAQGARLARAPDAVALQFSEPIASNGATVSIAVGGRRNPLEVTLQRQQGGLVLRALLAGRALGIYLVHWHIVAEDGHESEGEFAFAAGPTASTVPAARQQSRGPTARGALQSWLFFIGLSLAAGGLATGLVVDPSIGNGSTGVRAGLVAAAVGAGGAFIADAGASGTHGLSWRAAVAATAVVLLCAAMLAATWSRRRLPVLALVAGAALAWSTLGHAATRGGALGLALDTTHLLAAAVWVGALGYLALSLLRTRRDSGTRILPIVGAYARLALPLVAVLALAGALSAWRLLPQLSDLWSTAYGRLILAKSLLFGLALGLALVARVRGLGRGRPAGLRRVVPVEAGAALAVLVLSAVLVSSAPPAPARPVSSLLGPAPIAGPVVRDAGLAGMLTVAVAAGDGQLQVEVLVPGGADASTRAQLEAQFPDGRGATLYARPCGPGCLVQSLNLPVGTTHLSVEASAPGWTGGMFTSDLSWPPPPDDPGLLDTLVSRLRATPRLQMTEQVSSGPQAVAAPSESDLAGAEFLTGEPYAAGNASDVQPLAAGGPGFRLYVAGERIWATIWLDPQGRMARERVIDPGHDIERTFRYPAA